MNIEEIQHSTDDGDSSIYDDLTQLEGTHLAGRYRLTRLLDHGGFGAVYEALDDKFPGRHVAIKLGMAVSSERAFTREAMLIGQLNHENVVKVHDHGVEKGLPYIVMDMLHGVRLDVLVEQHSGQLPDLLLVNFVREIGAALYNLHQKQLVHRDLKPKNIMLVDTGSVDDQGEPLLRFILLDFGIASKIDATNSLANKTMDGAGTPEYMAPEQIAGRDTSPQTDLYAFGVILYQLLTGRVPFRLSGSSQVAIAQVITAIAHSPPPKFSEVAPNLQFEPALEELVLQCLSKTPEERPESVIEVRNRFLEVFRNRLPESDAVAFLPSEFQKGLTLPSAVSGTWKTGATTLPPRTLAPLLAIVALVFLGLGIAGSVFLSTRKPPQEVRLDVIFPSRMTIHAGETKPLSLTLTKVGESPVTLRSKKVPSGLSVPPTVETDEAVVMYPVSADLNIATGTKELILLAIQDGIEKEVRTKINVQPAQAWLPPSQSFPVSPAGTMKTIDGQNFYQSLVYKVPGQSPVRFLLIDSQNTTRKQNPFYIMENKVWNGLYGKFVSETPGISPLAESDSQQTQDWEQLPALGMKANDALRFARWLTGKAGQLPTTAQWWAAAGYFDKNRSPEFAKGPFRILKSTDTSQPPVPDRPRPVGTSTIDVSSHGVKDLDVNGMEWTSSSYPINSRVSYPLKDESISLYLVGNPFGFGRLSFELAHPYFDAQSDSLADSCPASATLSDCGFRLVLDIVPLQ